MPLLGRLLGRRPRPKPAPPKTEEDPEGAGDAHRRLHSPFQFTKEQVRVLLFRESERSGARLLFDSSTVRRVSFDSQATDDQIGGASYQYLSPKADVTLLSEMIFGSVAMNFKGMSLKMHILNSPPRLMCTKVFCTGDRTRLRIRTCSANIDSCERSSFSNSLEVPQENDDRRFSSLNWSQNKNDSGFCGDFSSQSSVNSYSNNDSSTSFFRERDDDLYDNSNENFYYGSSSTTDYQNSIKWRMDHHQMTNLSYSTSMKDSQEYTFPSKNYSESNSSRTSTADSLSGHGSCSQSSTNGSPLRAAKLGFAILITLNEDSKSRMLRFLMEHATLIETALDRLRYSLQYAKNDQQSPVSKMYYASNEAAQWFVDLVTVPRLCSPLWIALTGSQYEQNLANNFLEDFSYLLNTLDTKETYFFMSTLLTNVLTYHLGWVNSVSPHDDNLFSQKELDLLNYSHPYNPLWAQLGELYGAVGMPARISKTIVRGDKKDQLIIKKIISVLSYFVRCGKVKRFDVDSKPSTWWETYYDFLNDNPVEVILPKKESESPLKSDGDYIEMSTFSSNDTMVNRINSEMCTFSSNATLINNSIEEDCCKIKENSKESLLSVKSSLSTTKCSTTQLKRTKSHAKNLISSPSSPLPSNHCNVEDELKNRIENVSKQEIVDKPIEKQISSKHTNGDVVFVLGENEALVGIKDKLKVNSTDVRSSAVIEENVCSGETSQKDPPTMVDCCVKSSPCKHSKTAKHSGVKFEFDKYPRIVTNYMKSKNLELLDRHVIGKPGNLKIDGFEIESSSIVAEASEKCVNCSSLNSQMLQTPSNASELEFTSDIPPPSQEKIVPTIVEDPSDAKIEPSPKIFVRKKLENTVIILVNDTTNTGTDKGADFKETNSTSQKASVELPLPILAVKEEADVKDNGFCNTLLGAISDHYVADMVLQGMVNAANDDWERQVRRDLVLQRRSAPGGAACLVADIDKWDVKVWGSGGGAVGMSALIAAMLDTLAHMYKAKVPANHCLSYIESKLREFCVRSKTLAELLLSADFCDMNYLIRTLNLEPNDVPLLLAVASTHSPQVAMKYGVSFR